MPHHQPDLGDARTPHQFDSSGEPRRERPHETGSGMTPVAASDVMARWLLRSCGTVWSYARGQTHRGAKSLHTLLVMAMLVSALAPVLALITPTRPALAAGQTSATTATQSTASLVASTPVDVCQLYPIALHTSSLAGITVGGAIPSISNGSQPGNFGWLSWTGDQGVPTLVNSLTAPGDSTSYVNPNNANDHVLVVGDWVDGRPGVGNSSDVRNALTQLESQAIVVPVWDQAQGQGANTQYHVVGFAQVRITGFQLASLNTISARYLGSTDCLGTPPPPPPPPPSPFDGATLTLSPATAGPDVTGTTQALQATLTSRTGTPISGTTVQITITGANPTSGSVTTDTNGMATFSYTGANQGDDAAQAIATDSSGAQLQSNTAAIYWVTPAQTVSTTTIWGRFYPNPNNAGYFSATPQMTPSFGEAFPTINFNPPSGTVPGNTSGVNEFTRPITDVTTDLNGNFTGVIPAQGNGYQAGVGGLYTFDTVFTGAFTIAAPGDVTYNFYTDDGFILGIGNGATRVSGADTNPPSSGQTAFMSFPVMGAYNVPTSPSGNQVTVNFPAAGTYPFELDYSECCGGQLAVTAATATATGTQGVPPTGALTLSPSSVASQVAGGTQTFTALATYASGAPIPNATVELDITGANQQRLDATTDSTGQATFTYTGTYAGTDTVQAIAWISGLASYSSQVSLTWTPSTTPPATPQTQTPGWIASPAPNSIVSGQAPITLAANETLATGSGTVDYWPASNPSAVTTLATGVSGAGGATLATLDTTTLANGSYIIRLQGTDSNGNQLISETLVSVAGENKPGRVTFSVTDLTVPVTGLPITVGRTYDSLNKDQVGDFGNGWSLTIGSPKLTVDPAHNVTLTMPDGRRATFDFTPQSTGGLFGFLLTPGYTPEPGVYGSLTANGCSVLVVSGGQYVCFLDAQYAPTTYTYTDPYGRVYVMGADGSLKSITDMNGNELVFGPTGITSAAGNSVSFTRDSQGRITKITDPAGNVYSYGYDANGNLASVTFPGVSTPATYTYDTAHLLVSATDPRGNQVGATTYYPDGRLESVTDAKGNTTHYAYNLTANTTTITAPDGGVTTDAYNGSGLLVSEVAPLGGTTSYTYDANHNVVTMKDARGNVTKYTYDSQGRRTSTTDPLGKTSSVTYNQYGGPTALTDADGSTRTISYDAAMHPTSMVDSIGTEATYTWDTAGDLLSKADGNGNVTTYTYDAYGNKLSETDPLGGIQYWTYDQFGHPLTHKDARGNITTNTYDELGHLLSSKDPLGGLTTYSYDADGNQIEMVDPALHHTTYAYDAANHLTQTTYPDGSITYATYDFRGNPVSTTDQSGHVTSYTYDLNGETTSETVASGTADAATTAYSYDPDGNLLQVTDPLGNITKYAYDVAGYAASRTDPLGNVTSYTHDSAGLETSETDPNGHTTTFAHDARGRMTATTYPDGTTHQVTYDGDGHILTSVDQNGKQTTSTYDAAGHLLKVTDPLQESTQYTYDSNGNMLSMMDANGNTTSYQYDALNRLTKKILPDQTSVELYGYDAVGDLTSRQLTDGHIDHYQYDAMGQQTQVTYFDGTSVSYSYTPTGQVASMTDGRGVTNYTYDGQDRLTNVAYPNGQAVAYSYDLVGNRLSMTTLAGTTAYGYDAAGQLASVSGPGVGTTQFTYDKNGNLLTRAMSNGVTIAYGYNGLNRVTSISAQLGTAAPFASYTYTLDAAGNRLKEVDANGSSVSWGYDDAYHLINETFADPSGAITSQTSYGYDATGNRSSMTSGGQTTTYSYNSLDELTSLSGAQTEQLYYDGRGNLTSVVTGSGGAANTSTFTYSAANQLASVSLPNGAQASYTYAGDGHRISQTVTPAGSTSSQQTNYVWDDQSSNVVAETDSSGALQAAYTFAGGTLLGETQGGTASYAVEDGQGSVRALTSSSGVVMDTYQYDAYGNVLNHTGTSQNPYGYTGQRYDSATNLYDLRARAYDPATGRFLTRDSASVNTLNPQELNRYVYVHDDPINFSDPTGQSGTIAVSQPVPVAAPGDLGEYAAIIKSIAINIGIAAATALGEYVVCSLEYQLSIDLAVNHDSAGLIALEASDPGPNPRCHIPIVFYSKMIMRIISEHIENAQRGILGDPKDAGYGFLSTPKPMLLAYNGRPSDVGPITRQNRRAACTSARRAQLKLWYGSTYSCDEYPFASTIQGGAGSSTRAAPNTEQNLQGLLMSAFYNLNGFNRPGTQGKQFAAVVTP